MPVTLDHAQIQAALTQFGIGVHDYYLLFENTIVYLVWCELGDKALQHCQTNGCIDIEIRGEWLSAEELPDNYQAPTYCCLRYIIATN